MSKRYQLVIQFNFENFERLVNIENQILSIENDDLEVDGHDIGNNYMNIFIYTDNPKRNFKKIKKLLKNEKFTNEMSSGFREINSEEYIRIWPKGIRDKFEIL